MQTLDTYFESLKKSFFLNYTIHHGCPPYGYRITYPLRFLAKNIDYVKAVYSIHSKGE